MKNEPATPDILSEIRLGVDLSESNQQSLADLGRVLDLNADATIFREGDRHPLVYWIVDGRVGLDMSTGGSAPKLLLTLGSGDLLAWSAILGGRRMTSTAKTIMATRLLAFDADDLIALCRSNHEIGYQVMEHLAQQLAGRLVATRLQLLDLFRHPSGHAE
jgi:CRP/FNR family transcriptional regulator, cyclic AMP receptor protein